MKLCLLGNSHLAALKLGWNELRPSMPEFDLMFFGSPGVQIKHIAIAGNHVVPTNDRLKELFRITSGGLESINIDEFDAFACVGSTFGLSRFMRLHARYRADSHQDRSGRPHLISDALFVESARALLSTSLAARVVRTLRGATDKPIYVIPEPAPSANILEGSDGAKFKEMVRSRDNEKLWRMFKKLADGTFDEPTTVVHHPRNLAYKQAFTNARYSRGAVALQDASLALPSDDFLHMNGAYGRIVLQDLLRRISP